MANVKICDGRSHLFRWDTGVKIELCDCYNVTECHFVTEDGVIRRDVVGNICDVPDVALTKAGTLVVYAFSRTDEEGSTRHEFRIPVPDRPKPADYIDPPDESDTIDLIAERVAGLIEPGSGSGGGITKETDPTVPDWAKQKEKPTYTAKEVGAQPVGDYALRSEIPSVPVRSVNGKTGEVVLTASDVGALPVGTTIPAPYDLPTASATVKGGVRVGEGLQMDGDVLSVKPESQYELIDTITLNGEMAVELTQEPDGTPYNFSDIIVEIETSKNSTVAGHVYTDILMGAVAAAAYGLANGIAVGSKRFMATGVSITKGIAESFATSVGHDSSSATTIYRRPATAFADRFVDKVRITASVPFPEGTLVRIKAVRANA